MSEKNFYETLGYSLPDEVGDVKAEGGFEYYRHPVGIYHGVFGKLTAKYKDLNGEKCDDTTPGASISHFIAQIFLTRYLGTPAKPETKSILGFKNKFLIPADIKPAELYFPLLISYNPKDQWKVQRLFEKFAIPGNDNLKIVKQNPAKPSEKLTDFRAFPAYYGMPVKLTLDAGKKTGAPYCSSIEMIISERVDPEAMATIEQEIDALIKREIEQNKSNPDAGIPTEPPPSIDKLFDEDADLGEFTETV